MSESALDEIKRQIIEIGSEVKELSRKLDAYIESIKNKLDEVVKVIGL